MTLKYFNVKNGLTTGNIILNAGNSNISASTFIGNINVTNLANLGSIANVKITGGAANYVISTDGTGNLTWVAQSGGGGSSSISNGTSNVNIATSDGNVTTSVGGTSNVVVVTSTGINVAGTLNTTGNANVGNLGATNGVFTNVSGNGSGLTSITGANVTGQVSFAATANSVAGANVSGQVGNALVAGTVYTNAQPNITSVGTLSNLTSNGTVNFTNSSNVSLGAVGNVKITGGTANYVLSTDGTGNLSWVAQSGGGGGGAANITIESQGTELTNAVAVIDFVGTGVTATNVGNVVTITVPGIEAGTGTYLTRTYTGDGNAVSYTVTDGVTVSSVIVALNGVLQTPTTDYTVSSNVLTFSAAPAANEAIQIREFGTAIGGSNTQVQFNDNGGFGGNANLTFDKTTGTLNATNITANGTPLATTGKAIAMAIVFGF